MHTAEYREYSVNEAAGMTKIPRKNRGRAFNVVIWDKIFSSFNLYLELKSIHFLWKLQHGTCIWLKLKSERTASATGTKAIMLNARTNVFSVQQAKVVVHSQWSVSGV